MSERTPDPEQMPEAEQMPERAGPAVIATLLVLVNLMFAPGLAFLGLVWLYLRRASLSDFSRAHVVQAFWASLVAGVLIIIVLGVMAALGGLNSMNGWIIMILYFTCIHATLILFALVALVHAMNGKRYRYPLFGASLERRDCGPDRGA